ncbi:Regulatory-associated protein of mTOR [Papilio xuthus]|uniref:Regulatory-associated protein of mTOR n=1 Tax=Papilio xuthus TaxID=66420 RepID=A0A194QAN8_PAPXU|nr:Regulatory-associated protein of mTOR [Papilio xuthus]
MTEMPPYLAVKDEEKNSGQTDSECSDSEDDLPLSFDKPRHIEPIKGAEREEHSWRVKEKYKTHCVALVLCLNVGVDPPDVVKTQPCARLECWIDPNSLSPGKALESIGHALQSQYERWQPRARYKQSLDPTSDEIKKLCCSLRRNAKDERVLFHYNGHGVPKPTNQGEIWVFNRAYTQYIPLSMYDLQTWMGAPSLYVYDCSNAGIIVDNFKQFAEQHERDYEMQASSGRDTAASGSASGAGPSAGGGGVGGGGAGAAVSYRNCIQLGACAAGQTLPMSPELPADLFTACLTTPVKMAMKWFVLRSRVRVATHDLLDLIDKIPGQVSDRRTMLGELNWIFTAITDTIAWSSLPPDLFQQLFRADLLTASLCRNFLLADRIMRQLSLSLFISYNCTPVSSPALPSLAAHPLWAGWEHTLDLALAQLPALLADRPPDYCHSPFFRDQLTAFQVWLDLGKWSACRPPPDQLPMVLQVLLSTLHRVRALQILCRFLALGAWAVRAVLAVGIFPYMLKLLQASAHDLRASMVYIWAKIIAVDPSCQVDLVNAKGHKYFLSILQDPSVDSEHRTLAAFVLAGIVDNYPAGQEAALQGSMISLCLEQLTDGSARLRQWACVGLGRLWRNYDAARWAGVRDLAHEKLYALLHHPQPEVRAACAFALGTFVAAGGCAGRTEHANALDQQVGVQLAARLPPDASPLVRAELLAALQWLVLIFEQHFIAVYIQERMRRSTKDSRVGGAGGGGGRVEAGQDALAAARAPLPARHAHAALALPAYGFGSVYMKLWSALCGMAKEPHPQVSQMATDIINYISNQVDNVSREAEAVRSSSGSGSSSLPPSPNTRPAAFAGRGGEVKLNVVCVWRGGGGGVAGLAQLVSEQFISAEERQAAAKARHSDPNLSVGMGGMGGAGGAGAGGAAATSAGPPAVLLRWSETRRSLALAGLCGTVRLWDADAEMLSCDIGTETEAAATSLWRGPLLTCGFADGAVRAWDERAPAEPVFTLHDHAAPVLCAAHRAHQPHALLTGCAEGVVRVYDTRKLAAREVVRAPGPLAALDLHPLCNLLACGSVNQCISIYDLKGTPLNTIKFHEGFMGARIGPVSCLTFHPLRCALGVGAKDSTFNPTDEVCVCVCVVQWAGRGAGQGAGRHLVLKLGRYVISCVCSRAEQSRAAASASVQVAAELF